MATIKKKLPYELYDVAGLEDWFSQMAAEGYHLVDCWQSKAEFTVATPKENVRFRLEAVQTYQYDWNKDRAYAEAGWDHVATILGFYYIFRCDDPEVEELHTDPAIQSWTMKKLLRKQWFMLIWIPLYWVFMMRDQVGRLVKWPMYQLRESLLTDPMLMLNALVVLWLLYFLWTQGTMITMLSRLKKRLASGLPMDRSRRYPRSVLRHFSGWVLVAAYFGVAAFAFTIINRNPPEVNAADYPHVSLEEVIPGQYKYTQVQSFWTGASLEKSLFVPVHFKYGDAGNLKDSDERVRTYLNYYETRFDWVAKIMLRGSMQELSADFEEEAERREHYPSIFTSQLKMSTGPVREEHEKLDELYRWDYQYTASELNRVYFGRMGSKVFKLSVILPDAQAALEIMIGNLES